jgi:tetratricopeptide (TPR) repeat protein
MNVHFSQKLLTAVACVFLAAQLFAADTTNEWATPGVTREEVANNYLHIQEQIHESQLAIQKDQQSALDAAKSNADALAARLQSLEDSVTKQRASDAEAARKTQQTTLFLAGAFGLAGLGIMLLMVYFQWRAFTQLAQISSQPQNVLTNGSVVHQLAAPGRASVETANAQLLSVVDRLEQRINELESGQKLLPEIAANKPSELLTEGQKHLDANAPLKALECFDKYLAAHPDRAEALVKRAAALEKIGREEEALQCYNRAIAADSALVIAHLHKGGLLNRLRRYDEALNCYEQALLAQEKKVVAK